MLLPTPRLSLGPLVAVGHRALRLLGIERAPASGENDPQAAEAMRRAEAARAAGHADEARTLFRYVVQRWPAHVGALHALRDLAVEVRAWDEAIAIQESILALAPSRERHAEAEWLAAGYYELGRLELARGEAAAAAGHFRAALRADRDFVPASVALGDALEAAGDPREAVRAWERAAETYPVLPLLARLERAYREQDRPSRMIALYRAAAERAPDDLALAAALGRVYFELEMLDEAADQFEKIEVRAPDLPTVHAFLGAIFERRGDAREAFDEYRRALRLAHGFDWPHRCTACGAAAPRWQDRCDACRRWNTLRPASTR
jgi:lipopolysaccharide biosynthesis regulator YciM